MSDFTYPHAAQRAKTSRAGTVRFRPATHGPADRLRVFSTHVGSTSCVELSGQLDMETEAQLRTHLGTQIDRGARDILLDMSLVEFCDASMLRLLLATNRRLRDLHGRVRVVDSSHCVDRLLRVSRLEHFLHSPTH